MEEPKYDEYVFGGGRSWYGGSGTLVTSLPDVEGYPLDPIPVEDAFSATMVKTIPRKIAEWLARLEQDLTVPFSFGKIYFKLFPDGGLFEYGSALNDDLICIWWSGKVSEIEGISVNRDYLCTVRENLDKFVSAEQAIYSVMELFEEKFREENLPQISQEIPQVRQEKSAED